MHPIIPGKSSQQNPTVIFAESNSISPCSSHTFFNRQSEEKISLVFQQAQPLLEHSSKHVKVAKLDATVVIPNTPQKQGSTPFFSDSSIESEHAERRQYLPRICKEPEAKRLSSHFSFTQPSAYSRQKEAHMLSDVDKEECVKVLSEALASDPQYLEIQRTLGFYHFEKENYAKAIEHFNQLSSFEDSRFLEANYALGICHFRLKHYLETIACLSPLISKDHFLYWNVRYLLGVAYFSQEKYEEAIECFQEVPRFDPNYKEVPYNIGIAYLNQGYYPEAISSLVKYNHLASAPIKVKYPLGMTYFFNQNYRAAFLCLKCVPKFCSSYIDAQYHLGIISLIQDKYFKAKSHFEEVLNSLPPNQYYNGVYYYLGKIFQQHKHNHVALSFLKQIRETDPNFAEAQSLLEELTSSIHSNN